MEFLHQQPDHGVLFFKSIIEKIERTNEQNKPKMVEMLTKKIEVMESKLLESKNKIKESQGENKECGKYRITNIYYSKEQLERTSNKK